MRIGHFLFSNDKEKHWVFFSLSQSQLMLALVICPGWIPKCLSYSWGASTLCCGSGTPYQQWSETFPGGRFLFSCRDVSGPQPQASGSPTRQAELMKKAALFMFFFFFLPPHQLGQFVFPSDSRIQNFRARKGLPCCFLEVTNHKAHSYQQCIITFQHEEYL